MAAGKQLWARRKPRFVAIVGGSGAGKSWLTEQLVKRLGKEAGHISLDDFYRDRSHVWTPARDKINFDHPRAIDWEEVERVINELKDGRAVHLPQYDFASHTRKNAGKVFKPKPIIIFDGLWLLRRPAIRNAFNFRIFVHCPPQLRLERRLHRDCLERGRNCESVQQQFLQTVAPMHDRFVDPQRRWADIVVNHTSSSEHLDELAEQLRTLMNSKAPL